MFILDPQIETADICIIGGNLLIKISSSKVETNKAQIWLECPYINQSKKYAMK